MHSRHLLRVICIVIGRENDVKEKSHIIFFQSQQMKKCKLEKRVQKKTVIMNIMRLHIQLK